jgi:4a-hydroxytetrahydrobiopterin dehydratase
MEDKTILSKDEVLNEMPNNWLYQDNKLEREFQFLEFSKLIDFLKTCIKIMDETNHHSDLNLDTKNKIIKLSVTTHSENAITKADLDFAKTINDVKE